MSVEALTWALDARRTGAMSPEHRLVLAALADYANAEHDNQAWPKVSTLAQRIGTTTRSIHRALAALHEAGHIAKGDPRLVAHLPGDRRPNVWHLNLRGDSSVTPYGVTAVSQRGDSSVSDGVTAVSDRTNNRTTTEQPHPQTPAPALAPGPAAYRARAEARAARHRPDGTCRDCDDLHRPGDPCTPPAPPPPDWRTAPPPPETATPYDQPLPLEEGTDHE